MRVNEIYDRLTVQGEGPHTGKLCTFVRLWGCNLHCRWCDTPYSWDTSGRNGTPFPRVENMVELDVTEVLAAVTMTGAPLVVITGGEPMLQATDVARLADLLHACGIAVHVETNGTLFPDAHVLAAVDHWSVSPKMPTAEAGERAILPPVLSRWAQVPHAIFKVVAATPAQVHDAHALFESLGLPQHMRWIMPEGHTPDLVNLSLHAIADETVSLKMNLSPRLHVQVWGTERGR